jgi:hypothetical protein
MTPDDSVIESVMLQASDKQLPLEAEEKPDRTSDQIKAEIEARFGFVPPFFEPAEHTPQVLDNLWQQTLSAYVDNPLPDLFKEKLSAYLSRFCAVPYCMICHSCSLRPLGLRASEVLEMLEASPPIEAEVEEHLKILAAQSETLAIWQTPALEESLLVCAIFIALEHEKAEPYRQELQRLLGAADYQRLIAFIAYTKTCHLWIEAHPEVAYQTDQRVLNHLSAFLEDEPELATFFHNYREKVQQEQQKRAHQLIELAERKRREEVLQQQVDREHLLSEIAQRIRRSLDLEEILNTTVSEVRQFLQSDRVFIYRFQPDWSGVIAVESVASGWAATQGNVIKDSFFSEANCRELYQHGRIHAVDDVRTADLSPCHLEILERLEIRANLVVPIVQGEKLWGLLVANQCGEPRQWQPLDLNLLQHLATQLEIAIQQAELHQQVQSELAERKRSEEKIREQAALLDITTDAIFVLGLNQQILFWNKSAEVLYGWLADEALSINPNSLLNQNSLLSLEEIQKTVIDTGKWQGELYQVTKTGKEVLVESRWTLVLNDQGQPKSVLVVNTDITEKKQLEQQFLHAQRLEGLGTLASGISHDLNNILTPILAVAQLLQMKLTDTDESTRHLLKIQETSAKRGAALLQQVLSFARGVAGQRMTLQVMHLLLEIKQLANETFPKSIEIRTDIQSDLWTVFADATQLHQVLMNLCVNARDAMLEGGTLSISASNFFVDESYARMNVDAQIGPYVAITIADTGTGISPELLDKIFEPFFTTKAVGKGTGLGLSAVTGIVKDHGGFITVQSQLGRGTEFKLYLPAAQKTEVEQTEILDLPIGHDELVLVVDDEAAVRETTKATLEAYGYRVLTASDALEAVALYVQHQDDIRLVLADVMLPGVSGMTTIQVLKRINPLVKIIAISGLTLNNKVSEAKDSNVKAFLGKPYTAQELLKTLHLVLNSR